MLLTGPLEPANQRYAVAMIAGIKRVEAFRQQYSEDFKCGSRWSRENRVFRNTGFMVEAKNLSDLSRLYEWPPADERK
jgi:hypothetical protein